jgi:hypothetical protein
MNTETSYVYFYQRSWRETSLEETNMKVFERL